MVSLFLFTALILITRGSSFNPLVPIPPLAGRISNDLTLLPVSRNMAFSKIKQYQMKAIFRNAPKSICTELNDAREMLRSPDGENDYVSLLLSNRRKEHLYTVLYRVSDKMPYIYTVKAVVRTPEDYDSITIVDVERMLDQLCKDRMGYLQLFNLKTWANGKYRVEKYLEEQFLSP